MNAAKRRMLRHRYNITEIEYNEMYKKQDGKCGICKERRPLGGRTGLYVDHNHKTGEFRGLLCPNCNAAIGKLKESVILFARALIYLTEK